MKLDYFGYILGSFLVICDLKRNMFYFKVTIIVGLLAELSLEQSQVSDFQDRVHHEHFFRQTIDPNDLTACIRGRVLFPRAKSCVPPTQIIKRGFAEHGNKQKKTGGSENRYDGKWDSFLSVHHYDVGESLEDWKTEQEVPADHVDTDAAELSVFLYVILCYVLFIIMCVIILPIIGWLLFRVFYLLWKIISHKSIRFILRRIWISNEKRKLKQIALLKAIDPKSQKGSRRYRPVIPSWMRKYKEEEIPEELLEADEDSDGGESSDGLEPEYVTKTETSKILKKHPNKVSLKGKESHNTSSARKPKKQKKY